MCVSVSASVRGGMCVRVCVHVCVCACVRAYVCACVRERACVRVCVSPCVSVLAVFFGKSRFIHKSVIEN